MYFNLDTQSRHNDPILITGVGRRVGLHLAETFLERGIPVIGTSSVTRDGLDKLLSKVVRACGYGAPENS